MSEQLLKARPEAIPALLGKWAMYDVKGTQIIQTGANWHFTPPNDVHDDPECWHGHWAPKSGDNDKIIISRTNDADPTLKYTYEAIFAGNDVMVVSGSDEAPNRILIGLRIK